MTGEKRTQTEEYFDEFIPTVGGRRVDELLQDERQESADYVFESEGVILELKSMTQTTFEMKEHQDAFRALYLSWVERELMPAPMTRDVAISTDSLPAVCLEEFLQRAKQPLLRLVKKGNSQIKSTKALLDMPSAKGLLVLSNEGNFGYPPQALDATLNNLFRSNADGSIPYSSINACACIAIDIRAHLTGSPDNTAPHHASTRYNTEPFNTDFLSTVLSKWFEFVEARTGNVMPRGFRTDRDGLADLTLIRS